MKYWNLNATNFYFSSLIMPLIRSTLASLLIGYLSHSWVHVADVHLYASFSEILFCQWNCISVFVSAVYFYLITLFCFLRSSFHAVYMFALTGCMESCLETLSDVVHDYLIRMTHILRSAVDNEASRKDGPAVSFLASISQSSWSLKTRASLSRLLAVKFLTENSTILMFHWTLDHMPAR